MKKTIRLLLTMLFLSALTTVHAAPESFQQYYQSIFEFGSTVNQTEELVTFEENGSTYVAEISSSAPVSIYQLQNWGELIPHTSFGSAALQAVDAATGDFNADSITDLVICGALSEVWYGTGDGSFASPEPFVPNCSGVDAGQLDGSNGDDIVAATNSGVQVFVHNPLNPAQFDVTQSINTGTSFNDASLGRLSYESGTADTKLDIIAVADTTEEVWLGTGVGTFVFDVAQPSLQNHGQKVVTADYDLDGDDDVFVVSTNGGHAYNNVGGVLGVFIIPNFEHASTDVDLGFFDDEVGLDIIFAGESRAYFYTGTALQDWGQEFVGGSSTVLALNLDKDGDDDFIFGRKNASNLPFKGGPERVVTSVSPTQFSVTAETEQTAAELIQFSFSGTGSRQGSITWAESWISTDNESFDWETTLGASWFIDFDASSLSAGVYTDTLVVKTNDPENELTLIPVQMQVTAAEMSLFPTTFNVTTSIVSAPAQVLTTVSNTGTANMWVTISESVNWITTSSTPIFLPAGGSTEVTLTILPQSLQVGSYSGQVLFSPSKTYLDDMEVTVNLTVTGSQLYLPLIISEK